MADPFRVYAAQECGEDGYPFVWHRNDGSLDELIAELEIEETSGIKHIVRAQAGHRCLRCNHPFVVGESGVMEGPQAEAKSWAAELGVSVESLDFVFEEEGGFPPGLTREQEAKALEKARRVNWSRCDERCDHKGPLRVNVGDGDFLTDLDGRDEYTAREVIEGYNAAVEAAWRILTVHHLDEVKANLRWWNLVACCQRCHLTLQGKVSMAQVYPDEHSEWFKPYAAGYYAAVYLGEDLTRDQTMERLEELLALERMS